MSANILILGNIHFWRLTILIPILVSQKNPVMKLVYLNLLTQIFSNSLLLPSLLMQLTDYYSLILTEHCTYHNILIFYHYNPLKIQSDNYIVL